MNKKFLVCLQCKYFPNKADQIKKHGIGILPSGIEWQCDACSTVNSYPGSENIFLPESTLISFGSQSLLKNRGNASESGLRIDIHLPSPAKRQPLYYCPQFKEQIEKICKIELCHLKSIQNLEKQSHWFAQYRSFLKSYAKLVKNSDEIVQILTFEGFLVYILEEFVGCQQWNGSDIMIALTKKNLTFYFNIYRRRVNESTELEDFLKVYALLQFEAQKAWFLKLYSKLLSKYQANLSREQHLCKILLANTKDYQVQHFPHQQYSFVIQQTGRSDTNIFSASPLGTNPFINHIQKLKEASHRSKRDSTVLFFKREGQSGILKKELSIQKLALVRDILLQGQTTTQQRESLLNKHLKGILRAESGSKAKLVKLYSKLTAEEGERIFLLTFSWHRIERELLVELDEEVEEEHQLKEDILCEQYIRLQAPSPFLKKSQPTESRSPSLSDEQDDEEYL